MFSGWKKKCSNSQKSNDSILLVYLIVSTRQENCGSKARSDSVFEIVLLSFFLFCFVFVLPNQNVSHLKNINTFEKYQRDLHQCFDLTKDCTASRFMPSYLLSETVCCWWVEMGKRCYALVPLAGQPEENLSIMIARARVSINGMARSTPCLGSRSDLT